VSFQTNEVKIPIDVSFCYDYNNMVVKKALQSYFSFYLSLIQIVFKELSVGNLSRHHLQCNVLESIYRYNKRTDLMPLFSLPTLYLAMKVDILDLGCSFE